MRLGEPQSWSGCCGEEKISYPCQESNHCCPVCSLSLYQLNYPSYYITSFDLFMTYEHLIILSQIKILQNNGEHVSCFINLWAGGYNNIVWWKVFLMFQKNLLLLSCRRNYSVVPCTRPCHHSSHIHLSFSAVQPMQRNSTIEYLVKHSKMNNSG
jgi:hypothetical protein